VNKLMPWFDFGAALAKSELRLRFTRWHVVYLRLRGQTPV